MLINRTANTFFNAFFILFSLHLCALEYGISAKAGGRAPLKHYALIAERCSGSNYTEQLVLMNTYLESKSPWHKHFLPWFDLAPIYPEDPRNSDFKDYEDTIFIVIFRDPYDWARSLHPFPHHAAGWLFNLDFSTFIRTSWALNLDDIQLQKSKRHNALLDRDPIMKQSFKNIFRLRTAKIKDQLRLKDMVKNIYYVNYETLRDYPEEVLHELSSVFGIALKPSFQPILGYKKAHSKDKYSPKDYAPISEKDMKYINSQLNKGIEKQIGYKIRMISDPED